MNDLSIVCCDYLIWRRRFRKDKLLVVSSVFFSWWSFHSHSSSLHALSSPSALWYVQRWGGTVQIGENPAISSFYFLFFIWGNFFTKQPMMLVLLWYHVESRIYELQLARKQVNWIQNSLEKRAYTRTSTKSIRSQMSTGSGKSYYMYASLIIIMYVHIFH